MKTRAVLFVALTLACLARPAAGKQMWAKSVLGQKAPFFIVERWLTAQPQTKGKFVLIDFWATWCPPCRKAIPELNTIQQKFGDQLVVIGVSDEPEQKVRAMAEPKIEYAVAVDTRARMKNELKVTGIPHVILVDPSGVVRWEGFPFLAEDPLTPETVGAIIAKYGNGSAAPAKETTTSVPAADAPAASTTETAAEADKRLNAAYSALRARLASPAREQLKQEQLAWLSRWTRIADKAEQVRFVEQRVSELQTRTTGL